MIDYGTVEQFVGEHQLLVVRLPSGNDAAYIVGPRTARDAETIRYYGRHIATTFRGKWHRINPPRNLEGHNATPEEAAFARRLRNAERVI
jgi:hypothetical protein